MPEDEAWTPQLHLSTLVAGEFGFDRLPWMKLTLHHSRWQWRLGYGDKPASSWAFDPPTLEPGHVSGGYEDNSAESAKVQRWIREVWRLIARVATNHVKGGSQQTNILHRGTDRLLVAEAGGRSLWAGHHALEWCAADGARRMLDGKWRPCDDWAPPTDPWYQALRRKVEEQHGPDFGNPPPEPPD